jgi:mannose-6-phosphate isomerase-like protein (cupin superfamily)
MPYHLQATPFLVPTTDGKYIAEHEGLASSGNRQFSIAHMIAPPHWSEPFQTPEFDEYTLLSRGRKLIEVDGDKITLTEGQSILVKKGSTVKYSNPFDEECEYWSLCLPAFSPGTVHRKNN